jgi:hypothetical protein
LFKPVLMTSPSKINTFFESPRELSNCFLRASDRVDFPAPDRPVNQTVVPFSIEYLE